MRSIFQKLVYSVRARKAVSAVFVVGGLAGGPAAQAAAISQPANVPERVGAVREALANRIAQARELGGTEAIQKLPYAELQLASWLNWVNWPNWNNWADWNNWSNWSNWRNWINY